LEIGDVSFGEIVGLGQIANSPCMMGHVNAYDILQSLCLSALE